MRLINLRVFQFRNLENQEIPFSAGTNLLSGANGQGKTNLLEAVCMLGYGKSFRTASPRDCIRHGAEEGSVEGLLEHGSVMRKIQVWIGPGGKRLSVHGKPVGIEEFAGNFHVVIFAQDHLKIVRAGPGERRSFLDRAMITSFPGHLRHLASYSRALKQRNRILTEARNGGVADEALLSSWEETLVREGSRILANRIRYVGEMKSRLPRDLFGAEVLSIAYSSSVGGATSDWQSIEGEFKGALFRARPLDRRLGTTSVGPHRDDLVLLLDGKPIDSFGSAGQQRSCLLSLYFTQMEIHRETHGFYPVFLIDDFEAELDDRRLKTFLEYLARRTQVVLTTAKSAFVPLLPGEVTRYEVANGKALLSA